MEEKTKYGKRKGRPWKRERMDYMGLSPADARAELTDRQRECLGVVLSYVHDSGYLPTCLEVAHRMGLRSPNAAYLHLQALHRKGFIDLQGGRARGLRLLRNLAGESIERWHAVPELLEGMA